MRHFRFASVCCLQLVLGVWAAMSPSASASEWRIGLAQVKITPDRPVLMAGYGSRKTPFARVETELFAKALVLEDDAGRRGVIVTSDLIGFTAEVADPIYQRIAQRTGLRREQILISAAHTHTGPQVDLTPSVDIIENEGERQRIVDYTRELQDRVVEVVVQALERLEPGELAWGSGIVHFVMNRRQFTPNGIVLGANPRGLADRSVPMLSITDAAGKPRAILFGAAVHNTTLRPNCYDICGDYAGFAQIELQERYPGVQAMFLLGCAGDADPYPHGTMELARQHGKSLADEVARVLETKLQHVHGPLQIAFGDVDLPLDTNRRRDDLEKLAANPRTPHGAVAAQMLAVLQRNEKVPAHYTCPVAVWQLGGDLTLVGLSGEVVVDYVPLLERALGPNQLWIAAYCHDVFGYFPSARLLAEGGYETRGIYKGGFGFFAPVAESVLIDKVRELAIRAGRKVPR